MKIPNCLWGLVLAMPLAAAIAAAPPQQGKSASPPPEWAYGFKTPLGSPPGLEPASTATNTLPDDGKVINLTGSALSLTLTQYRSSPTVVDWFPGDHPPMPPMIS